MKIIEAIERLQSHKNLFGNQEMVFVTPSEDGLRMKPFEMMALTQMTEKCVVLLNEKETYKDHEANEDAD